MNSEFIAALGDIERERGISKDILIDAFESALIAAYKRNYGTNGNVRAVVDRDTGEVQIFASKTVVEEVNDPYAEISLPNARKINHLYEVGDVLEEEVDPRKFGRIAAQTAKQVVVQRIREAERGMVYERYSDRENDIVTRTVQRIEGHNVFIDLGTAEGLLLPNEQIPHETYDYHQRLKCYVVVELKIVDFMPEFIGKLNFYVSAADELLRGEGDNPSIGILLCKDKDSSVVEWSLRGITTPLGVASYQLQEVYERTLLEIKQEASEEE